VIKAGNAIASQLVHQLMGHAQPVMPPRPRPLLPEADQKVIQQWIDAGCTEYGFNTQAKPIFQRSCNSCHSPGVAAGGISFKTYELVKPHILFPGQVAPAVGSDHSGSHSHHAHGSATRPATLHEFRRR
jgi:hypothetical protein